MFRSFPSPEGQVFTDTDLESRQEGVGMFSLNYFIGGSILLWGITLTMNLRFNSGRWDVTEWVCWWVSEKQKEIHRKSPCLSSTGCYHSLELWQPLCDHGGKEINMLRVANQKDGENEGLAAKLTNSTPPYLQISCCYEIINYLLFKALESSFLFLAAQNTLGPCHPMEI